MWEGIYKRLADDDPGGLLGAVIARDSAQVLRLSLTYALLDGSAVIDVEHIRAAEALWNDCRDSAAYIFGHRLEDPVAERLLDALRKAGDAGLTRDEQYTALGRHIKADRFHRRRPFGQVQARRSMNRSDRWATPGGARLLRAG